VRALDFWFGLSKSTKLVLLLVASVCYQIAIQFYFYLQGLEQHQLRIITTKCPICRTAVLFRRVSI
jgi:ABC-type uncharacterized transport system permease subunit